MLLCLEGTGWLVNVTTPLVSMEVKGPQSTKLAHMWAVSSGQRTFPLLREWQLPINAILFLPAQVPSRCCYSVSRILTISFLLKSSHILLTSFLTSTHKSHFKLGLLSELLAPLPSIFSTFIIVIRGRGSGREGERKDQWSKQMKRTTCSTKQRWLGSVGRQSPFQSSMLFRKGCLETGGEEGWSWGKEKESKCLTQSLS